MTGLKVNLSWLLFQIIPSALSTVGVCKSRLSNFGDISVLGREFEIANEFETHFVKRNLCDSKVEIALLDNYINSSTFDNEFKKSSM